MTEEMLEAAEAVQEAVNKYRQLFESENGKSPVIWIKNNVDGSGLFLCDNFNFEILMEGLIKFECENCV